MHKYTIRDNCIYYASNIAEPRGTNMGVTLYTFEVPLGTPMKKVGTSGTPMLEALLKV